MVLTRFELSFDGNPQGVGMFQGLTDVGMPNHQYSKILDLFEQLPSPYIDMRDEAFDHIDGDTLSFWFTPAGVKRFSGAIRELRRAISDYGWELLKAEIDDQYVDPIYEDAYQMAVPVGQAKNLMPKFKKYKGGTQE